MENIWKYYMENKYMLFISFFHFTIYLKLYVNKLSKENTAPKSLYAASINISYFVISLGRKNVFLVVLNFHV